MFELSLLPQNAVLPVDCHTETTNPTHAAIPVADVIDNYPPLPTK